MSTLIGGLLTFFGVHAISILNNDWRSRMAAKLGEVPWKGLYSLISLIGLVLIVRGYAEVRYTSMIVYSPAPWLNHLAMSLMVPVFPLLVSTYFPGRIRAFVRHPMLIAIIIWACAHLLVNGRLCDILLFGSFLVWAMLDLLSISRRKQRTTPGFPEHKVNDLLAVIVGLALYALFVALLHGVLIGVPLLHHP